MVCLCCSSCWRHCPSNQLSQAVSHDKISAGVPESSVDASLDYNLRFRSVLPGSIFAVSDCFPSVYVGKHVCIPSLSFSTCCWEIVVQKLSAHKLNASSCSCWLFLLGSPGCPVLFCEVLFYTQTTIFSSLTRALHSHPLQKPVIPLCPRSHLLRHHSLAASAQVWLFGMAAGPDREPEWAHRPAGHSPGPPRLHSPHWHLSAAVCCLCCAGAQPAPCGRRSGHDLAPPPHRCSALPLLQGKHILHHIPARRLACPLPHSPPLSGGNTLCWLAPASFSPAPTGKHITHYIPALQVSLPLPLPFWEHFLPHTPLRRLAPLPIPPLPPRKLGCKVFPGQGGLVAWAKLRVGMWFRRLFIGRRRLTCEMACDVEGCSQAV